MHDQLVLSAQMIFRFLYIECAQSKQSHMTSICEIGQNYKRKCLYTEYVSKLRFKLECVS